MLGTKLLLLCFVVYVSGQGVSYHGSSNVRTQSRLPPRPLGPYKSVYQPTSEQIRPVYDPQPVYQPPQPVYQPPQLVYQPPQPAYERPSEAPALAPEIPPQPIYQPIPPHPANIPSQPSRPIDFHPRPLPPWTWRPVKSTETPVEINTPGYKPKAVDPEAPVESVSELIPEEPIVDLLPEATTASPSIPEDSLPNVEEPEEIPETPLIDTSDPEQPTSYPEPLEPVSILEPQPEPISFSGSFPTPRPIPRPFPTFGPVISPEPTPEPVSEPIPEAPVDSAPMRPVASLPPIQPVLPPRPNYRPIPTAPAPTQTPSSPQPVPLPSRPDYQPLKPPAPSPPRPLIPVPLAPRPTYEPLRPPTPYPTPVSSLAPVPTQLPPQPTSYPVLPPTSIGPAPGVPDVSLIIPMNNFECSNGNGYYKIINECDAYIKCENRRAFKYSCPDGLHFNPEALYPEYPCAYPSQVQCESTASKQIARPTNECPHRYGFFSIPEGDCSKYVMCQEGKATLMNCPFGLVFNDQLSSCDWPENVPQCNPDAFKGFTCPTPPEDDPDELTRHRYRSNSDTVRPSDCGMYVACQRGHPRLLRCDAGMSFDLNSQVCIDSDLVAECRITNQH